MCYFHYSYNIGKNIKIKIISKLKKDSINEYNKEIDNINNIRHGLLAIPFIIEKNKNIVEEIFKKYKKNKNYSCRYDSFLLIYELTIKNLLHKLNYKYGITDLYNDLSDKILYMSKDELEDEIWTLIDNINKNKYSFISKGYKVIKILIPLVN